jgi:hypothetical protein
LPYIYFYGFFGLPFLNFRWYWISCQRLGFVLFFVWISYLSIETKLLRSDRNGYSLGLCWSQIEKY